MPEVEPSPHSPQHTDDYVPWWVWLCRMLWKILAYLGTAVVLGAVASLIATWLTTPQGVIPANTPFRQLLASWPIVLPVGCCLLLLALFIRTLGRWPTSVKNEGESSGQIKKVAAPLETAVPPSPSTTTQHLSEDNPLQLTIPTDEFDLPAPSFFVGRKMEQDWLAERLHKGGPSAISAVCGLGGIGKTSLVAWTVQQLRKREPTCFPGGIAVVFCENQTLVEEVLRGIVERFAPALVQPQTANQEQLRTLVRRLLLDKDALVILDNIEPKLAIEQVMAPLGASGVHVILTARQRLPFDIAPPEASKILDLLSPNEALDVFACRLGYSLARQLPAKARRASKRITSLLDNHPLAITLAGAYAAQLQIDLAELADQLADPQRALDLPQDEIPQAVRKMFSHSVQKLPDTAQRLFAGLAVFAQRDFGYEAAIALATALSLSPQSAPPWHEVDMLLRRLLVGKTQNARMAETSDRIRLHLHPLLHALARSLFQQWSSEAQDQAHRAVASYYVTYANQLDAQFTAAVSQQTVVDEAAFLADEENMTDKLEWALKQPQEDVLVANLCLGMRRFWRDRWRVKASKTYLQRGLLAAMRLANTAQDSAALQRLVELARYAGYCSLYAWDEQWPDNAEQNFTTMLQAAQQAYDQMAESAALFFLGHVALLRQQPEEAEQYFQHSRALREKLQQPDPQEWPLDAITFNQIVRKRQYADIAQRHYQEAVVIAVANNDLLGEGVNQFSLGELAIISQRYEDAVKHYQKPLDIVQRVGFRTAEGIIRCLLGEIAIEQGRLEQAEADLKIGLGMLRESRNWREEGWVHCYLGELAQKRGHWTHAGRQYEEGQLLAEQVQDDLCLGTILFRRAEIAEVCGDSKQAENLYRQALALHTKIQSGFEIARVRLGLGRVLLEKNGNRADGEALVRQAIQEYTEMGIPELDRARKEAERLHVWVE